VGVEAAAVKTTAIALVLTGLLGFQFWPQESRGNRAHRRGDYARAAERYRKAMEADGASARLHYNLGSTLLRLAQADGAREHLGAALRAKSPELRAQAFYNLGNALAQTPAANVEAENLRAAVDAYRRSLLLDPGNEDARWNLELTLRRLEEEERQSSMPGREPQRPEEGSQGEGGADAGRAGDSQVPLPVLGDADQRRSSAPDAADTPLPPELAEQILRAVEERERGLQREKLRQRRHRVSGPDW
jgi:tetratricopeptide (TPR) repeat protein